MNDPNSHNTTARFISIWWRVFRNQRLTVRNILLRAIEGGDETADLRAILKEIAPSPYAGAYSPHKLGRWLARSGGRRIEIHDNAPWSETYTFVDHGAIEGGRSRTWQLVSESYNQAKEASDAALPEGFVDAVLG